VKSLLTAWAALSWPTVLRCKSHKLQAASGKRQAASLTNNKYRIIKEKVMRESKYSFLYQAHDGSIMRPESFLNINKGRTLSGSQLRALGITKIKNKSFKRQAPSCKLDK
jgi:hypothetical protein